MIEQWAFFFLFADGYEPERLRALLPGVEFQQAISVVEAIAAKTEDRMMYDQRLKAQRDYQWGLDSARQKCLEKGKGKGNPCRCHKPYLGLRNTTGNGDCE